MQPLHDQVSLACETRRNSSPRVFVSCVDAKSSATVRRWRCVQTNLRPPATLLRELFHRKASVLAVIALRTKPHSTSSFFLPQGATVRRPLHRRASVEERRETKPDECKRGRPSGTHRIDTDAQLWQSTSISIYRFFILQYQNPPSQRLLCAIQPSVVDVPARFAGQASTKPRALVPNRLDLPTDTLAIDGHYAPK